MERNTAWHLTSNALFLSSYSIRLLRPAQYISCQRSGPGGIEIEGTSSVLKNDLEIIKGWVVTDIESHLRANVDAASQVEVSCRSLKTRRDGHLHYLRVQDMKYTIPLMHKHNYRYASVHDSGPNSFLAFSLSPVESPSFRFRPSLFNERRGILVSTPRLLAQISCLPTSSATDTEQGVTSPTAAQTVHLGKHDFTIIRHRTYHVWFA